MAAAAAAAAADTAVEEEAPGTVSVEPGVVVGTGRVGSALLRMGPPGGDAAIGRGQAIPEASAGPIFVCTRNDALDAIVDATPQPRRPDLVFLQNGMLEPWLESKGLQDNTQVLVYFAIAKLGQDPVDGITDVNPEGLTVATGKWAPAVAARLQSAGLTCKVLKVEDFQQPMLEKLIWICAFMLVGARHPGATVGVVEKDHKDEIVPLIKELSRAAADAKGITFTGGVEDRLMAYAHSVAHFPTAVKEFEWRNGWIYNLSQAALAAGKEDPCPLHTSWLKELGIAK